mgnify:CR=1 FL=1|jgi:hypothetical protein
MEINQICFFNIGFADKISDDYFDLLGTGVGVLYGENECVLIKYYKDKKATFEIIDYLKKDWWLSASDFIINENKYKVDIKLVEGLLQCAENEDEDGLYDYMQENQGQVVFDDPKNETKEIGFYCIKQKTEDFFEFKKNKLFLNENELKIDDLAGLLDDLNFLMIFWSK